MYSTNHWGLMKNYYKGNLSVGIIFIILGGILLFPIGNAPSIASLVLGLGTALTILGLSGYISALHGTKGEKMFFYLLEPLLLIISILMIISLILFYPYAESLEILGDCLFSISFFVFCWTALIFGKLNKNIAIAAGIPLFIAGFLIFIFFGLLPPNHEYLHISIIPLLSGSIMIFSATHYFKIKSVLEMHMVPRFGGTVNR